MHKLFLFIAVLCLVSCSGVSVCASSVERITYSGPVTCDYGAALTTKSAGDELYAVCTCPEPTPTPIEKPFPTPEFP